LVLVDLVEITFLRPDTDSWIWQMFGAVSARLYMAKF